MTVVTSNPSPSETVDIAVWIWTVSLSCRDRGLWFSRPGGAHSDGGYSTPRLSSTASCPNLPREENICWYFIDD